MSTIAPSAPAPTLTDASTSGGKGETTDPAAFAADLETALTTLASATTAATADLPVATAAAPPTLTASATPTAEASPALTADLPVATPAPQPAATPAPQPAAIAAPIIPAAAVPGDVPTSPAADPVRAAAPSEVTESAPAAAPDVASAPTLEAATSVISDGLADDAVAAPAPSIDGPDATPSLPQTPAVIPARVVAEAPVGETQPAITVAAGSQAQEPESTDTPAKPKTEDAPTDAPTLDQATTVVPAVSAPNVPTPLSTNVPPVVPLPPVEGRTATPSPVATAAAAVSGVTPAETTPTDTSSAVPAPATPPPPAAVAPAPAPAVAPLQTPDEVAAPAAPARAQAPDLVGQLSRPLQSLRSFGDGTHVISISVTPENLGPVAVRAHISGDSMRIELVAPTDQARAAIKDILPDLRRDLSGAGGQATLDLSSGNQPSGRESAPRDTAPSSRSNEIVASTPAPGIRATNRSDVGLDVLA